MACSLDGLSNGSKAKIRNIMSGIFSHAIRYEMADKNPSTAVRQSGKREKVPVILEVAELHRLFDELALRERAMIICDALTGMRRSELMVCSGRTWTSGAPHQHCAQRGRPGNWHMQGRSIPQAFAYG